MAVFLDPVHNILAHTSSEADCRAYNSHVIETFSGVYTSMNSLKGSERNLTSADIHPILDVNHSAPVIQELHFHALALYNLSDQYGLETLGQHTKWLE